MYYRCENQLSHAISMCLKMFSSVRDACLESLPQSTVMVCWSLMLPRACDLKQRLGDLCNAKREVNVTIEILFVFEGRLKIIKYIYLFLTSDRPRFGRRLHSPQKS